MKKFLLSAILILTLCGCSNGANTKSRSALNTSEYVQAAAARFLFTDYDSKEDAEPDKRNMPYNTLPSKEPSGKLKGEVIKENSPEAPKAFDEREGIKLLPLD